MEPCWGTGLSPVIAAAAMRGPSSSVGDISRVTLFLQPQQSQYMTHGLSWTKVSLGTFRFLKDLVNYKQIFLCLLCAFREKWKVHSQLHCLQSSQPSNTFLYKPWTSALHNYSNSWTSTTSSTKACRLPSMTKGGFLETPLCWGPLVLFQSNEFSPLPDDSRCFSWKRCIENLSKQKVSNNFIIIKLTSICKNTCLIYTLITRQKLLWNYHFL